MAKRLVFVLLVLAGKFDKLLGYDSQEICQDEDLSLSCTNDEIVVITSAEYGRKDVGRCITKADEFMGCTNDVKHVLDRWCSGRSDCLIHPQQWNDVLDNANANCRDILRMYMKVDYACEKVLKPSTRCLTPSTTPITATTGSLSSYMAQTTGCGSSRSPLKIEMKPGQTIDFTLLDFSGDSSKHNSFVSCKYVYGYILERSLGINHTVCCGGERQVALYASKTHVVEITLLPQQARNVEFIVQYKAMGCQDPPHPPQSWYKRQGNEVVIGCEKNDQEWRLICIGGSWEGTIGNCSMPVKQQPVIHKESSAIPVPSLIIVACIIGGAVVVTVAAIMCGVIHLKKYRMKQERKRMKMQMDYATIGRQSCGNYGITSKEEPLIRLEAQNQNTLMGTTKKEKEPIWKMPLPEPVPDPPSNGVDPCACVTLPGHVSNVANNGDNMDFGDAGNYQNSSVKYSSLGK